MPVLKHGWRAWLSAAVVAITLAWVLYAGVGTLAGWFGFQPNPDRVNAITLGVLVPLAAAAMALILVND